MSDISALANEAWDELKADFKTEDHDSIRHILKRIGEETARLTHVSTKDDALLNIKHLVTTLEGYTIKYKIKSISLARQFTGKLWMKILTAYL